MVGNKEDQLAEKVTAVVLSGQTAGLGVIRALGMRGIPVRVGYNHPGDMGRKSRYAQMAVWLPHPENEEADYLSHLLSDATAPIGSLIIPTSDATLAVVSRHKARLEGKYRVAAPVWELTQQFLDKKNTAQVAAAAGVPAPKTLLPRSREEIETWGRQLQYPVLAKPSQVHLYHALFNKKMSMADNFDELLAAFREVEGTGIELMVQEFIPGADHLGANYNAYYWEGEPLVEFTAHKIRNAPPVMGSPSVLVSETLPAVIEQGRKLLSAARYSGFACTEFKQDPRDGVYKLMEVNARHNMSSLLAVRCGINFPWIEYQHLVNGIMPTSQSFEQGIYWIDSTRDFGHRALNLGKENLPLGQFFQPYLQKHVYAIFDWRDPYPAVLRAQDLVSTVASQGRAGF